jgi:endoglucanase
MSSSCPLPCLRITGVPRVLLLTLLFALACVPSTAPAPGAAAATAASPAPVSPVAANEAAADHAAADPAAGQPGALLEPFDSARLERPQETIRVEGNRFVNASGATVVFQGVSIEDPDDLQRNGHWNRGLFEAIASWNANLVRLPVHPPRLRRRGAREYFELLDQAVLWANQLGLYLIMDWHSIGNLLQGRFQDPQYDTSEAETIQFWRSVASRYRQVPTVALYELFNEPTSGPQGRLGSSSWPDWKRFNEQLIDVIREHNPAAIALVAGFDWAYDLRPVAEAPVERPAVAYVSHPYPGKTRPPYPAKWDEAFGFVAQRYPLIATEIGYMPPDARGAHVPAIDTGNYGPEITDYLARKGASWVAWCFSPGWPPTLIADWSYTANDAGNQFRAVMKQRPAR